jgi:hypothetical protein
MTKIAAKTPSPTKTPSPAKAMIKKFAASLAVVAMVVTMIPADAFAGDRGQRGGGHSYNNGGHGGGHYRSGRSNYRGSHRGGYRNNYRGGHRSRYRGGHYGRHSNAWIPFAFLGATALTYAIANDRNRDRRVNNGTYSNRTYSNTTGYSATKPCHMAYRDENHEGELMRMAATMCYDEYGTAYLVKGSEHQVAIE